MGSLLLILSLLSTVYSVQIHPVEKVEEVNLVYKGENENVEDKWYWGFADSIKPVIKYQNDKLHNVTGSPLELYNPCAPYKPVKPDFNALGRCVSEIKCSEYIWEQKQMEELYTRKTQCIAKLYQDKLYRPPTTVRGGRDARPGEFPHMSAIGWKTVKNQYVFQCGSSVISSKFVLTAAHCSKASKSETALADPVPKIVRLSGSNVLIFTFRNGSTVRDVNIARIIVHPQYKSPKKYYDIALMELDRDVGIQDLVRPACLWSKINLTKTREAILTGWGVLQSGSYDISPKLQAANIDIIDTKTCNDLMQRSKNRHWNGVADHQLCAGKLAGGVDACQGDSGGPLQVKLSSGKTLTDNIYYILGVTSFGIGCALPNSPGIYTRVDSFLDWIEEIVWPNYPRIRSEGV